SSCSDQRKPYAGTIAMSLPPGFRILLISLSAGRSSRTCSSTSSAVTKSTLSFLSAIASAWEVKMSSRLRSRQNPSASGEISLPIVLNSFPKAERFKPVPQPRSNSKDSSPFGLCSRSNHLTSLRRPTNHQYRSSISYIFEYSDDFIRLQWSLVEVYTYWFSLKRRRRSLIPAQGWSAATTLGSDQK